MGDLKGKRALVGGGTHGIGAAAAEALRERSAAVTILARSATGTNALACDLEDIASLTTTIKKEIDANGTFEVLINNSAGPPAGPLLEAAPADFEKALRRHLLASHTLVQLLLPGMRKAGYGRIINIISTSVREPIPGLGVSNTVRGAMAAWAKTLSRELPPGVTINSILPGYTATRRLEELKQTLAEQRGVTPDAVEKAWLATVPEGRLAQPSELGAVIAFLASPEAGFVRGVALPVDGGRLSSI